MDQCFIRDQVASFTANQQLLEAAALLETFDLRALAALLDEQIGAIPPMLIATGIVYADGSHFRLNPAIQAVIEQELHQTPERLRDLACRAASYYALRLNSAAPQNQAALEVTAMRYVEQYCELLIQQEPTRLATALAELPLERVRQARHRHLLWYYRALSYGLVEQYTAARAEFTSLLAEPKLNDALRARVLNSEGTFARLQGDYQRARDSFQSSYALWQRLGNPAREGLALMNLGILNYYLQEYALAERQLTTSLELFRQVENVHWQAMAWTNLGLVSRDLGHWERSLAAFREAAAIFERDGPIDFLAQVTNNIAEVELLQGQFDLAAAHFERALEQMCTRTFAVDAQLGLGLIRQAQGDHTAALHHYQAALAIVQELGRREIVAQVLYRIGHAEQRRHNPEAALHHYALAVEAIEAVWATTSDESLQISIMGRWQQVYEAAILLCLEQGNVALAFNYAERARARAFADMLARHNPGLSPTDAAPITADEVQALIPDRTVLLAYVATGLNNPETALLRACDPQVRTCLETPSRLLLLALTASDIRVHDCGLNPNVFHASSPYLADGQRFLAPNLLRRVYRSLITPAADLVAGSRRMVIIPHGPLHQLPFTALLNDADEPLLEHGPDLIYAPSATVLFRAGRSQTCQAEELCLAVGYDGGSNRNLRHVEPEAETVAAICGQAVAWRGDPGIQKRLRSAVGRYRWLHFACHGEFDHDNPLRSYLEIGPGEKLSAADVLADYQLQAELVTLSACHSGLSRVLRGDEAMGLVRTFLRSGARSVLVTLWMVEDISARLLMEHFYTTLLAQQPRDPASALRAAQRYLRQLRTSEVVEWLAQRGETLPESLRAEPEAQPFANPLFWAPYALVCGGLSPSTSI